MKTFEEWWNEKGRLFLGTPAATQAAWHARDGEIAELQRQLEPSPCGVAGHRRADWVEDNSSSTGQPIKYCVGCSREEALNRIKEAVAAWDSLVYSQGEGPTDEEVELAQDEMHEALRALPEREAASRKEAK